MRESLSDSWVYDASRWRFCQCVAVDIVTGHPGTLPPLPHSRQDKLEGLLDSRVVNVLRSSNLIVVTLSSLKPFFFNGLQ